MRAETLKKENEELIQQTENLSQTNKELQKTISDQKEKINRLSADLCKAVNKPPGAMSIHWTQKVELFYRVINMG